MEKEIKTEVNDGIKITEKVQKTLLEIFVYGLDEKKDSLHTFLTKIQAQLDSRKAKNRARILWCAHKEEQTFEEINKWFMENANCKYYVYANTYDNYEVPKDFVDSVLDKIKKFEKGYSELKKADIKFYKH